MSPNNALVSALAAGIALMPPVAAASRVVQVATVAASAPSNLGVVKALDTIREDRMLHQLRVKLDNGEWRTVVQERLNDVRLGDRVEVDGDQAYRHDTRAERIDRWGYRVDADGRRYDDTGLRIDDGQSE